MSGQAGQDRLVRWAAERLGFDPRALKMKALLAVAQREEDGLGSASALERALDEREDALEQALVAAVTVGETYFFRQREHFDLLAQLPVPADGRLLAWSAGCSSGEETYSLSAALRQVSGLEHPQLAVWGTDINQQSLAKAEAGDYGRWSWRGGDSRTDQLLESIALERQTRACVRFARHNLLEAPRFDGGAGERFDLIFCRNVLVYFGVQAAAQAVAAMTDVLKPGGWLVLGSTDLPGAPMGFHRVGPSALCAYAKDRPGASVAPPSVPLPRPTSATAPPPPKPGPVVPDAVALHKAVLVELEGGQRANALRDLADLVRRHPRYLPGRFELALALRRQGHPHGAAVELHMVMELAEGLAPEQAVDGPESLSLEFYVNSARSFLAGMGEEA